MGETTRFWLLCFRQDFFFFALLPPCCWAFTLFYTSFWGNGPTFKSFVLYQMGSFELPVPPPILLATQMSFFLLERFLKNVSCKEREFALLSHYLFMFELSIIQADSVKK